MQAKIGVVFNFFSGMIEKSETEQNPMKLVAVTVTTGAKSMTTFVRGEIGADGKVRVSPTVIRDLLNLLGANRGECYAVR